MDEKGKEERVEIGISGKRSRRWTGRQNIPFVSPPSPQFFLLIGFLVDLSSLHLTRIGLCTFTHVILEVV